MADPDVPAPQPTAHFGRAMLAARPLEPACTHRNHGTVGAARSRRSARRATRSSAINALLNSFDLRAGDEILLFDHTYGAARNAAEFAARRAGARVHTAAMPSPRAEPQAVFDAVERAINPRTRLAIVDHITSCSALLLPRAERLAAAVLARV